MRGNRRSSYFIEVFRAAEGRTERADAGVECGDALAQRVFLSGGAGYERRRRFLQLLGLLCQRRYVGGRRFHRRTVTVRSIKVVARFEI